jgi:YVTN family beta-propeller protein
VNDSIAAISLLFTDQVAIVNVNSGQVIQNVLVGVGPEGIKYYNGKIYVANTGFNGAGYDPGTISVIDAGTFLVIDTINVGLNPWDLDVDSQERLIVVCAGNYATVSGQMDIVNLNTGNVVNTVPFISSPTSVGINSLDQCYVGTFGSGVTVYNLITQSFERDESNPLPGGPGIDYDAQNNVYITDFNEDSVRVFSLSHQKIAAYGVGDGPASISIYDPSVTNIGFTNLTKPVNFELYQNYPNPFNPTTNIRFEISDFGFVSLNIYDLSGKLVRTLISETKRPDMYIVQWDGRDNTGRLLASGVYFYHLRVGGSSKINKMYLIR